jgi:hypothetical protein
MAPENASPSLEERYQELNCASSVGTRAGEITRRIPSQSSCNLFIGVECPVQLRFFRAEFASSAAPSPLPAFAALEIQANPQAAGGAVRQQVTVRAPSVLVNDIFTTLAQDVLQVTAQQTAESAAAQTFYSRLFQWQRLLQKSASVGLTEEEQQGLWGELRFIDDVLCSRLPLAECIAAWTGPEATPKDFQFRGGRAAEVKTARFAQPQRVHLSSESQLDSTGLNALYLVCLAIERVRGAGETLPERVQQVRSALASDAAASALFEDKLFAAGYLDLHALRYQEWGYVLRGMTGYHVREGFPCLVPAVLPAGIGEVRYVLDLTACQAFVIDWNMFDVSQTEEDTDES